MKVSIKTKLVMGFVACAAIAAVVGGIGIIALLRMGESMDKYIALGANLRDDARKIDVAMLQGRRDEKDFLMRRDTSYSDAVKKDVEQVVQNAQAIKKALPAGDKLQAAQDEIIKLAGEYEKGFFQVVSGITTRGNTDTGLEGQFRAKAHDVESTVNGLGMLQLDRDYLEIRRNEKDYLLRGDAQYVTQLGESVTTFKSHLTKSGASPAAKANMVKLWDEYADLFNQLVETDKHIAADTETYRATVHNIEPLIAQSVADVEKDAAAEHDAAEALKNSTMILVIATIIAAVAAALILGLLLSTSISRPLIRMVGVARKMAEGDLTLDVKVKNRDEVGELAQAFNHMSGKLNAMMRQVLESSSQLASSSEEISASAEQLASGSQNQASTLEETSASIEELSASVEQVAEHAQSQAASVEESSSSTQQLQATVEQVSQTMSTVLKTARDAMDKAREGAESVTKVVDAIKSISESSEKIAGIVNVISDIADQTNLLALNASIEAARAGEHGRGFAVVADEVSKLADRSASSTKEIGALIGDSGKSVATGVQIAEATLKAMDMIIDGSKKTGQMIEALSGDLQQGLNGIKEVGKAAESISEMSQSISAATEQQSTNSKQVSKAIENVNELTQQAASAAEEMSAATVELSGLAQKLQGLVEQFKLSSEKGEGKPAIASTAAGSGNGNGKGLDAAMELAEIRQQEMHVQVQ
jgi:methyl-accepting chemotaxis protein